MSLLGSSSCKSYIWWPMFSCTWDALEATCGAKLEEPSVKLGLGKVASKLGFPYFFQKKAKLGM